MRFKLFISDYDGTLGVAPKNDIDAETRSAIKEFTDKGGIFTVCSGRETQSITRILREQNLQGIVVSFQGACVSDIQSGRKIMSEGLGYDKAIEVLDAVEKYGLTPLCYGENNFFYNEKTPYVQNYENAIRLTGKVANVKKEIEKNKGKVFKICWLGEDEIVNRAANELNAIYKGDGVNFNSGAKCLLEAINPKYGKGNAVRFLARHYNVGLDEIITVGDSTNDIELVGGPWHGVAVGDGRDELKAVAKEVTVPFSQKPVLTLLKKYCLD